MTQTSTTAVPATEPPATEQPTTRPPTTEQPTTRPPTTGRPATQWFKGSIEGFFMGQIDRAGSMGSAAYGRGYRLLVYRAAIRDVELLAWETPQVNVTRTESVEPDGQVEPNDGGKPGDEENAAMTSSEELTAPLVLPPWLPAPGTAFFQPTITDARLFPVRHTAGWYEGPVHQVFIEDFRATHSKQSGKRLYGRFVGKVQAYFAMPEAPRPVAAERIIQAFQEVPEDEHPPDVAGAHPTDSHTLDARLNEVASAAEPARAKPNNTSARSGPPSGEAPRLGSPEPQTQTKPTPTPAGASTSKQEGRVPLLILVLLVAAGLLLTCGAGRALIWLFFLLPTLVVRRILRGIVPDSTLVSGFSALLGLAQVWVTGMVFMSWWGGHCRDVHALPLIGTLVGLAIACALPSDIPLLVNTSSLAALLFGWCSARGVECQSSWPNIERANVSAYSTASLGRTNLRNAPVDPRASLIEQLEVRR